MLGFRKDNGAQRVSWSCSDARRIERNRVAHIGDVVTALILSSCPPYRIDEVALTLAS